MSNALKKKSNSNINAYIKEMTERSGNKRAYDRYFESTFVSLQLINACVMYTDFDFEKQKMKNFTYKFEEVYDYLNKDNYDLVRKEVDEKAKVDCRQTAKEFPYRVKVKMAGDLRKKSDIAEAVSNATDSVEMFLVIAIKTLRDHYRFSAEKVHHWIERLVETSRLYAEGLTDEFVMNYIKEILEWEIVTESK